jgi:hypothetical protein
MAIKRSSIMPLLNQYDEARDAVVVATAAEREAEAAVNVAREAREEAEARVDSIRRAIAKMHRDAVNAAQQGTEDDEERDDEGEEGDAEDAEAAEEAGVASGDTRGVSRIVSILGRIAAAGRRGILARDLGTFLGMDDPRGLGPVMSYTGRVVRGVGFAPEDVFYKERPGGEAYWYAGEHCQDAITALKDALAREAAAG